MMDTATFAAGCFWGVEADFQTLPGVVSTRVGYVGGHTENPTYEQVCSKNTGHAEAVEIMFDSNMITYEALLSVFWECHDPTTLNRQGPDIGSQYRSAIFTHSQAQWDTAILSKEEQNRSGRFSSPIVTEITAAPVFYPAEAYHQQYVQKRGGSHCKNH
jgi:peptide-methionine (S)-S-oxide reductase